MLLNKFKEIMENIDNIPLGEIKSFAENLDIKVQTEIKKYEAEIEALKEYYHKFGQNYLVTNKMPKSVTVRQVGGISVTCQVITNYREALKFPHQPCVFQNVQNLFVFAFPELGQILPVQEINTLINFDNVQTKMHYAVYSDSPLDATINSSYAVVPLNSDIWQKFTHCPTKNWSKIMKQLHLTIPGIKSFPLSTTNCIKEVAPTINPEQLSAQWSMFAQMYFLFYLFRVAADSNKKINRDHFTL